MRLDRFQGIDASAGNSDEAVVNRTYDLRVNPEIGFVEQVIAARDVTGQAVLQWRERIVSAAVLHGAEEEFEGCARYHLSLDRGAAERDRRFRAGGTPCPAGTQGGLCGL